MTTSVQNQHHQTARPASAQPQLHSTIAVDSSHGLIGWERRVWQIGAQTFWTSVCHTAASPFGPKSIAEIETIAANLLVRLRGFNPACCFSACVTFDAVAGRFAESVLGARFLGPIQPTVKAIRRVHWGSRGRIAVLATQATISTERFREEFKDAGVDSDEVLFVPAGDLVRRISNSLMTPAEIAMYAAPMIRGLIDQDVSTISLSSTHLSFLAEPIRNAFPELSVVDSAECLAEAAVEWLQLNEQAVLTPAFASTYFVTGDCQQFADRAKQLAPEISATVKPLDLAESFESPGQ